MSGEIAEHVAEGAANLGRRPEHVLVVVVREHRAVAPHEPIEAARDAHAQALHAARKRDRVARLDDEMDVVALHREADDAQIAPFVRSAQRRADDAEASAAPQVPDVIAYAQRDVHREARRKPGSRPVGDAGAFSLRLSTRAGTAAAPSAEREGELRCAVARHLDWGDISGWV